jgi:invasion protein IalB
MFLSAKRLVAVSAAASLLLAGNLFATTSAFAQAAQPQQAAPAGAPAAQDPNASQAVALQPVAADWTKVCGSEPAPAPAPAGTTRKICYTTRDFGQDPADGPILAMAVYDVQGDDTKIIRFLTPIGLMLHPGIRITVDKNPQMQQLQGNYEICLPNGCFAELQVKGPALIDGLKKGTLLTVSVKNQVGNQVDFVLPLKDFGKAFDGPPIDPAKLAEQQKAEQAAIDQKAHDLQQQLQNQQQQPGAPAPAQPDAAGGVALPPK